MPLCVLCNSRFYYQTHLDPAETCDCGREVTAEDFRSSDLYNGPDRWDEDLNDSMEEV